MNHPDDIWELPTKHIGRRVQVYKSLPSTNDTAAELPSGDGTVILAQEQTAGRGQFGRSWRSPSGHGVLISTVLVAPTEVQQSAVLTGWSAISVCETLQTFGIEHATIKWPNDVLVCNKKICGVLIERCRHTIAGIGINANQTTDDFAAAGLPDAISLRMLLGHTVCTNDVARRLIECLDREFDALLAGELAALQLRWQQRLGVVGQHVRVELHGDTVIVGSLLQLTFNSLVLTESSGSRRALRPEEVRQISLQPTL